MSMPKIPNGSAPPLDCTQSAAKKDQEKAMIERKIVTRVKQSDARVPYESIS